MIPKNILIFDTETTGLPEKDATVFQHKKWPYIIQLSYVLYNLESNDFKYRNDYIKIDDSNVIGTGNIISYTNHGLSQGQEITIEGFNYNIDGEGIRKTIVNRFDNNTFQIKYEDDDSIEGDLTDTFNLNTVKRLYNGNLVEDNQFMGWDEIRSSFILGLTRFDSLLIIKLELKLDL